VSFEILLQPHGVRMPLLLRHVRRLQQLLRRAPPLIAVTNPPPPISSTNSTLPPGGSGQRALAPLLGVPGTTWHLTSCRSRGSPTYFSSIPLVSALQRSTHQGAVAGHRTQVTSMDAW
jgi:hypothetical protein